MTHLQGSHGVVKFFIKNDTKGDTQVLLTTHCILALLEFWRSKCWQHVLHSMECIMHSLISECISSLAFLMDSGEN